MTVTCHNYDTKVMKLVKTIVHMFILHKNFLNTRTILRHHLKASSLLHKMETKEYFFVLYNFQRNITKQLR